MPLFTFCDMRSPKSNFGYTWLYVVDNVANNGGVVSRDGHISTGQGKIVVGNGNNVDVVNSAPVNLNDLPESVSEEVFKRVHEMLSAFIKSDEAEDSLTVKQTKAFEEKLKDAPKRGFKKGWSFLREFLAANADIVTITTAITAYLANHPEIPQAIMSVFGK